MSTPQRVGYLVRHGRTALNADGRLRGHLDPSLDDVGRAEVAALADALRSRLTAGSRVYSSPLRRAVSTAQAVARSLDLRIQTDERLIDRDYGPWAGHRRDEVESAWGGIDAAPGVEPRLAVLGRALALLHDLELGPADDSTGDPVVLVAHDAVNQVLLEALGCGSREHPPRQRTACWNRLELGPGGWVVTATDRISALPDGPHLDAGRW